MAKTIDLEQIISPDELATQIAERWTEWNTLRVKKVEEWKEVRNYLFATDTRTTSNSRLPWAHTTTTPKLTQIRDNLHANYFAAIFPQRKWMKWVADDASSNSKAKRSAIQAYMENKVEQSGFVDTVSRLIYDWIDYGNCFAMNEYARDVVFNEEGLPTIQYVGPRLIRISPYDIVFNPTAASFKDSPKIIRSVMSLGDLAKLIEDDPSKQDWGVIFDKAMQNRGSVLGWNNGTISKTDGYIADGFSSIQRYYESDYIELLTFYGNIYDKYNKVLRRNRIITVIDRSYIVEDVENPSWLGYAPIHHVGWRDRPDNLYSMGPLDNLVGMQYRIDHLENMRATIFDRIAAADIVIKGDVEEKQDGVIKRWYVGDEGGVAYLSPDATALQADFQIQQLEQKMEEMAGAPKMAMGLRTPGEKTAFEVDVLSNAANRIFLHKTAHFERMFLEPVLNDQLETARRNMDSSDIIRVFEDSIGATLFQEITKEDLTAKGKIIPLGARHFADRARKVQEITQIQMAKQDPTVGVHLSGKRLAQLLAEELGDDKLFSENIQIAEQLETQRVSEEAAVDFEEEQMALADMEGGAV
jgi:hypothetical protein